MALGLMEGLASGHGYLTLTSRTPGTFPAFDFGAGTDMSVLPWPERCATVGAGFP